MNAIESELTTEKLKEVTGAFMDAAAGERSDSARDPGLLVTNDDIRSIKRYVKAGLELPSEISQIRLLLGGEHSEISGLTPEDIQRLYKEIIAHAKTWSPIEAGMKQVGSDLVIFSGSLRDTGKVVIDFVKSTEGYKSNIGKIEGLSEEEIERFPEISLGEDDQNKIPTLLALVEELKKIIMHHSRSTSDIKGRISTFKNRLQDDIAPAVGLKITLMQDNGLNQEITELTSKIDQLNTLIEEKIQEYNSYAKYTWVGAWWGPIGLAISASIYGPKAAAANKEKDRLIREKQQLTAQLERLSKFLAALTVLHTNFQDLRIRIDGASASASNLESLWFVLLDYIEASYTRMNGTTNATLLFLLVIRLQAIIAQWASVEVQARHLLTAFNNVLDETR